MKCIINEIPLFKICVADTFVKRFQGLLGTARLDDNMGLLLLPCNSVHMLGMRYAIDVVYIDEEGYIVKLVENLPPWYGFSLCLKAYGTLEVNGGLIRYYGWRVGQKLLSMKK